MTEHINKNIYHYLGNYEISSIIQSIKDKNSRRATCFGVMHKNEFELLLIGDTDDYEWEIISPVLIIELFYCCA